MTVSQALASLADPAVLDAVDPAPDEVFDPQTFLARNGTLYLLATGAGAGASWPLVAAFMEDTPRSLDTRPQAHRTPGSIRPFSWHSMRSAISRPSPRSPS